MRLKMVAGNWKMNKNLQEGKELAREIALQCREMQEVEIILAPPFVHLSELFAIIGHQAGVKLAAQNCHQEPMGAFTGEVSASMVASAGCHYVIIGHSERRQYAGETGAILREKVNRVLENDMRPIFCCGEALADREEDRQMTVVETQLREGLFHLDEANLGRVVIAYEPVWAIGTGRTATPEQAQEMHAWIRHVLATKYGEKPAQEISILYGGSCKPDNARDLFRMDDVDGGLIGGASLKSRDFCDIIKSFPQ